MNSTPSHFTFVHHRDHSMGFNGIIRVIFMKVVNPTSARDITVEVAGTESCSFHNLLDMREKGRAGDFELSTTKTLKVVKPSVLHHFEGIIATGSYVFPFSIQLPSIIQNTFQLSAREGPKWNGKVKYNIIVQLNADDPIQASHSIRLYTAPDGDGPTNTKTFKRSSLRGLKHQAYEMSIRLDKPWYQVDTTAKVDITFSVASGSGTVTITGNSMKLYRLLNFYIDEPEHNHKDCKCTVKKVMSFCPEAEDGGKLLIWKTQLPQQARVDVKRGLRNLFIPLTGSKMFTVTPTTEGKHIQCKYVLEVCANIEGSGDIEIVVPIEHIIDERGTNDQNVKELPVWVEHAKVMVDETSSVHGDPLSVDEFTFPKANRCKSTSVI